MVAPAEAESQQTTGGAAPPERRGYLTAGNEKRETEDASRFPFPVSRFYMEARGIEPRSENDSDAATTCVGDAS